MLSQNIEKYNTYISKEEEIDYIIHTASITQSKVMVENPVETIMTAIYGTINMLELAKEKICKGFIYVSSMEVYGVVTEDKLIKENELGYIDILKVRSSYPEAKRMCENICIAYYNQHNIPVKIARLAQTFGAGVLPGENRVFAQFARSVIKKESIVLHTTGESQGNYCYTRDVIYALLLLLEKGTDGEVYNVANEKCHTTIKDMAEMVVNEIAQGEIDLVIKSENVNRYGYAPSTKLKLCTEKINLLGWEAEVDLLESYQRMIQSMRSTKNF